MKNKIKMSIEEILQKIILISQRDILDQDYLFDLAIKTNKNLLVCDSPVEKASNWKRDGNIFYKKIDNITIGNIDHHFEIEEFQKNISTTNLAIEQSRRYTNHFANNDFIVVINHTDCDAILSALIVIGALIADEKFGKSAVAADHTGEKNEIADLLQAMEYERDLSSSLKNLILFLETGQVEKKAQKLLNSRKEERTRAKNLFEKGEIKNENGIYYIVVKERVDPAFFFSFLPEVEILLVFSSRENKKIETRIRLGIKAKIKTLYELEISKFNPEYGGRWNAGSDERNGGSKITEKEHVNFLLKKYKKVAK